MKKKLIERFKNKAYFLVLFPLFFFVHGYNDFFDFYSADQLMLNLGFTLGFILIFYFISYVYYRDKHKASVFALILSVVFFTFGSFHDFLKETGFLALISSYKVILPLIGFILIVLAILIKRKQKLGINTFLFLNILFSTLLFYEVCISINYAMPNKRSKLLLDGRFNAVADFHTEKDITDSLKPDIFFLLFDAFPSTKAMKKEWGFDNASLDSFLLDQHFYIADNSKSNYNITLLSLNSCFNMDYFTENQIYQNGEIGMIRRGSRSLNNNSLLSILKRQGYSISVNETVSLAPEYEKDKSFFGPLLKNNYIYKTLIGRMYRDLGWALFKNNFTRKYLDRHQEHVYVQKKEALLSTIERLKQAIGTLNNPKFIYSHFMIPHSPFIYDSIGNIKTLKEIREKYVNCKEKAFIEQVKFADIVIKDLITSIKKNNRKNTIIILLGDHGYRNAFGKGYMIFDNLTAIYYPDENYKTLYDSISPVNIFRHLLNKEFGSTLDLLKDTSIFVPYNVILKN